jgi:hypothetical protein
MPTVAPTYSTKPDVTRVYHNNSRCAARNKIEAGARRRGTGGRPLCARCCLLRAQGK